MEGPANGTEALPFKGVFFGQQRLIDFSIPVIPVSPVVNLLLNIQLGTAHRALP